MDEQEKLAIYESISRQYDKAALAGNQEAMERLKRAYADFQKIEAEKLMAEAAKRAASKVPPPPFAGRVVPRYQTASWNLEPMHLGHQLHLPNLTISSQLNRRMAERIGFLRRNNPQGIFYGR